MKIIMPVLFRAGQIEIDAEAVERRLEFLRWRKQRVDEKFAEFVKKMEAQNGLDRP